MSEKRSRSLLYKLLAAFFVLILLLMTASTVVISNLTDKYLISTIIQKNNIVLESLNQSASSLINNKDFDSLKKLIRKIAPSPFISKIDICDSGGRLIASSDVNAGNAVCNKNFNNIAIENSLQNNKLLHDNNSYASLLPITETVFSLSSDSINKSFIVLSSNLMHEKIIFNEFVEIFIFENLALLVIAAVLMTAVIYLFVIKPVRKSREVIKKISSGNYDFELKTFSDDELGSMTEALNSMAKAVQKSNLEIKNNNYILNEYKIAIDSSAIVIKSDYCGKITYVNKLFKDITGFSDEEIIGQSIISLRGDDLEIENILDCWDSLLNCIVWKSVLKNKTKDGKDYYTNITVSPVQDVNGEIIEYIDIWHNVTEIYTLKEELEAHKDNLEKIVEERTSQLQQVQTTIIHQEKMASIGHLAAGVAHELNNPIGFIASNFDVLNDYFDKITDFIMLSETSLNSIVNKCSVDCKSNIINEYENILGSKKNAQINYIMSDTKDLFNESKEGFKRITSIINSLRNFSRIDYDGNISMYNLNEGLRDTLTITRNETENIEIVTKLEEMPNIMCLGSEINQVFLNLIINAAHAVKSTGKGNGRIEIRTFLEGDNLCCTIKDNGCGIPENIKDKIFNPFFTTKEPGVGTGLGLSISYDIIVNKHGGVMSMNSDSDGTVFFMSIPENQSKADI